MLLSFVLSPLVELLRRIWLGRVLSVVLAVVLALGLILALSAGTGRMTLIRGGGVKKESAGTTPCTPRRPANPHCLNRPESRATAGSAQPRFAFQLLFPLNSVRVGGRSCCRGEHRFGLRHHASGSGVCRVPLVIGKTARSGSALRNGVRGP